LPVLAWMGWEWWYYGDSRPAHRFAFLIKSIELFVVGGIYAIGGRYFCGNHLRPSLRRLIVQIPEVIQKLMAPAASASSSCWAAQHLRPLAPPAQQNFRHGLSKLVHYADAPADAADTCWC